MKIGSVMLSLLLTIVLGSTRLLAEPRADARFIVDRQFNQKVVDVMIDSMEPLLRQALSGELAKGANAGLSQGARNFVIDAFIAEFRARFLNSMREEMVQIFVTEFSSTELADFKAFLNTPSGRAVSDKQASLMRRGNKSGERVGREMGPAVAAAIGSRLAADGKRLIANAEDLEILRRAFPSR